MQKSAAQAAKSAVEYANETTQFTDDADTDTAQIVDDTVVNVVNVIDTVKTPEDSGTTYRLDEVTSTSDKGKFPQQLASGADSKN
jgi:hypothetical protein